MSTTLLCLSLLVFHEARGESLKGKQAVLEVVDNRTRNSNFPDNPCSVIKQPNQFSWYKNSIKPPKSDNQDWKESQEVAKNFYTNRTNHTNGALYFNHKRLGVRFGKSLKCKIGNHVFF